MGYRLVRQTTKLYLVGILAAINRCNPHDNYERLLPSKLIYVASGSGE
jgi:hypothetical protein